MIQKSIIRILPFVCLLAFSVIPSVSGDSISAREVVERIKKNVTCEWAAETVDTFKAGNPDDPVTGIAVTFMATMDVLKKAAEAGCNFIITHEPTFYNHLDEIADLKDDPVLTAKQNYIREHNLIVFRFHDHIHMTDPDGIVKGMVRAIGWERFVKTGETIVFDIPPVSVKALASELKKTFSAKTIRVIGDPGLVSGKAALSVGASGSISQMRLLERDDVEILLAGETREWETVEYVRDASQAGMRKAIIILGHAISEESGMIYCAEWLKKFVGEVPVTFIPAGEPFWAP